jgi:hypothetical protein
MATIFMGKLLRFGGDTRGAIAIVFGLALIPLMIGAGIAIDYSGSSNVRNSLQNASDASALAAASAVALNTADRIKLAKDVHAANYVGVNSTAPSVTVVIGQSDVTVTASASRPTSLMGIVGIDSVAVNARSVVAIPATGGACVIALHPSASMALRLDSNAKITAPGCTVHSNSSSSTGMSAKSNSTITAEKNCVVGGYEGSSGNYTPTPSTCPSVSDPLASIAAPTVGGCNHNDFELDDANTSINPGVYCGGILIKNNSNVTFNPGTYIIKNGGLNIEGNSEINGTGVAFYLTGSDATIFFDSNTIVDFTAPTTGPLAGLIFFEDRSASTSNEHKFFSNNVSRLEGAIYLSRGTFWVDSNTVIGANSKFTTVVARKIWLDSNVNLQVNTDYDGSSIPNVAGGSGVSNIVIAK